MSEKPVATSTQILQKLPGPPPSKLTLIDGLRRPTTLMKNLKFELKVAEIEKQHLDYLAAARKSFLINRLDHIEETDWMYKPLEEVYGYKPTKVSAKDVERRLGITTEFPDIYKYRF